MAQLYRSSIEALSTNSEAALLNRNLSLNEANIGRVTRCRTW